MRALRHFASDIALLYQRHRPVAMVTWLPLVVMVAMQPRADMLGVGLVMAVVTVFGQALLAAYSLSLRCRMIVLDDSAWTVQVNGVDKGVISDAEYAAMRERAMFSVSTYLRQAGNLVSGGLMFVHWLIRNVPLILFWMPLVGLLLDATVTVAAIKTILIGAQTQPEKLAVIVAQWLSYTLVWSAMIGLLLMHRQLGIRSEFRAAWEHELRRWLNVHALGEITLSRIEDDQLVFADEGKAFRTFLRQRRAAAGDAASGAGEGAR